MQENIKKEIENMLNNNKVFLFMKGYKDMPMCGFSRQVIEILNQLNVDYEIFNVLENEEIRDGIKEYSNWPTFPQLWVNKELIGGCDIICEMYEEGELEKIFN